MPFNKSIVTVDENNRDAAAAWRPILWDCFPGDPQGEQKAWGPFNKSSQIELPTNCRKATITIFQPSVNTIANVIF